jgi:hypothetical protein
MALTLELVRREIDRLRDRRRRSTDDAERAGLQAEINNLMTIRDAMVAEEDADFADDVRRIANNLDAIRAAADLSAESAIAASIRNLKAALPGGA